MIFGLIGSTVLTLVVQPVAYMSLEVWRKRPFGGATLDGEVTDGEITDWEATN
jgi:hypothetical protein